MNRPSWPCKRRWFMRIFQNKTRGHIGLLWFRINLILFLILEQLVARSIVMATKSFHNKIVPGIILSFLNDISSSKTLEILKLIYIVEHQCSYANMRQNEYIPDKSLSSSTARDLQNQSGTTVFHVITCYLNVTHRFNRYCLNFEQYHYQCQKNTLKGSWGLSSIQQISTRVVYYSDHYKSVLLQIFRKTLLFMQVFEK